MQATDIQEPEWLALIAARPEFAVPTPADWWPQHYPLYKLFATVRDECGELNAKTVTAYCDRYFGKHFGECTDDSDPLAEGVNDWLMHQSVTLAGIAAMAGEEVKAAKRIEDQRKAVAEQSKTQQQTARNAQIETLRRLAGAQKEKGQ